MPSDREDDLGRTVTAPLAAGSVRGASDGELIGDTIGVMLGRYRLERKLGAGGMGVVHAAFDPDLERRIALKVLRLAASGTEAKDRLLREARAMARLAHPNVVTVHEVGTAGGRDYVAMELIEGETLADWLREARREPDDIVDAFVAAGRGLAAAHAAGIVHRDFKPHNVLRSRDGRIVVTDFGLARSAEADLPASSAGAAAPSPLDATLPLGALAAAAARTTSKQSSLSGITVTGTMLGTPAYMAPEQWRGATVTPATDQFAYCVALWEALVGERPYPGPTLDELRTQVARGPGALDVSKLPRRLRATLRRGLAPEPAKRWPSMAALLARVTRRERRAGLALAVAGGAVVALATAMLLGGGGGDEPACGPPARPIAEVWSPAILAELRARTSQEYVRVFDGELARWQAARAKSCAAAPLARPAQLRCLDGVLARLDVIRQAYARVPAATDEDILAELIDPTVCTQADVPQVTIPSQPDVVAAYELFARAETAGRPSEQDIVELADRPGLDPCARAIAAIVYSNAITDTPRERERITEGITAADQCRDDRLRADVLIEAVPFELELPVVGPRGEAAIRRAEVAAARVAQPDVEALIASYVAVTARLRGDYSEALRVTERVIEGYGQRGLWRRQLTAVLDRNLLRVLRSDPGDLDAVRADVAKWQDTARMFKAPRYQRALEHLDALARFWLGDATAHDDLVRVWQTAERRALAGGSRTFEGEVVDARGRPVAGATVVAAASLTSSSHGIGMPILDFDIGMQRTTTDAAGRFRITDTVLRGSVQAQLGALRSVPAAIADRVKLVLEPTRRLAGRVELGAVPHSKAEIAVVHGDRPLDDSFLIAPVARDGSFAIDGVPVGPVQIGVGVRTLVDQRHETVQLPASAAPVTDLRLTLTSTNRTIDVIVRSTLASPHSAAQVIVLPGRHDIPTTAALRKWKGPALHAMLARPIVGERGLGAVADQVRSGDMIARVSHAPRGELTVCAVGMQGDLLDPVVRERLQNHLHELRLKCEHVAADARSAVVRAPPQDRFE